MTACAYTLDGVHTCSCGETLGHFCAVHAVAHTQRGVCPSYLRLFYAGPKLYQVLSSSSVELKIAGLHLGSYLQHTVFKLRALNKVSLLQYTCGLQV